ncbi:hypothetical protein HGP16_25550 [Rhizobium sp. P40RR-XXII]|uniref:hypothetical protein n=1 Tax=Rhizobium sp. P40RR-XXII TaxID=2726739 RepID=UPI001456DC92|nr:hypothetical protein [Rhizobium sp. P40RR-XXII]NLS19908.1 hypothetical protein [Rhizobium sp. P40RR-XXII]
MSFQFIENPTGSGMTDAEFVTSALDQPMSLGSTFWDQSKGGVLSSFGLGTAIRDLGTPEVAPPDDGGTISGALGAINRTIAPDSIIRNVLGTGYNGADPMTKDQYEASPSFRKDIPFQKGMTTDRAAALAAMDDAKKVRDFYAQKRPITSFIGNLAGSAIDPLNYIPVAGEAVIGANVARFGKVGGRIISGAMDAAGNAALAGVATAPTRGELGDDISWQSTLSQIGMAGLVGGAFGALHGVFGRDVSPTVRADAEEKLATLNNVQASRVALNDALDGLINNSEVSLSPTSANFVGRLADQVNPAWSPALFGKIDRNDLFSSTGVGRFMDNRPAPVQDFETTIRSEVFRNDPVLAQRYHDAEAKFQQAQDAVAAIEEPLAARRTSDTVGLIDPASAERLRAVEAELAGNIPAARRQALEQEQQSIVQSIGPDAIAKAENDFRIGPTKQAKAARKALASARQEFSKVRSAADEAGQRVLAENRVRYQSAVDTSTPQVEADPAVVQAEKRVKLPEAPKEMAEQYRVNPETGEFPEMADIDQLRNSGRLTEEDMVSLDVADETVKTATAYSEALKAFAGCAI